jgi:hypothetical protein
VTFSTILLPIIRYRFSDCCSDKNLVGKYSFNIFGTFYDLICFSRPDLFLTYHVQWLQKKNGKRKFSYLTILIK